MASSATAAAAVDQIRVERRGDMLDLRWSDADERLQGTVYPSIPRAGEPLTVSLHVGNFQGAEFEGPLTLTFHQPGQPALVTRTLTREGVNWHTELTPDASGIWELEVRYRHTHLKVLTARIPVSEPPLPRGLGWGLITLAAGTALVLGVRGVLRRIRTQAPESGPTGAASGSASQAAVAPAAPAASEDAAAPASPAASEAAAAPVDAAASASSAAPESPAAPDSAVAPTPPADPNATR